MKTLTPTDQKIIKILIIGMVIFTWIATLKMSYHIGKAVAYGDRSVSFVYSK